MKANEQEVLLKAPLKACIRHLPIFVTEEILRKAVSSWENDMCYWYFVPGKSSTTKFVASKVFIGFTSAEKLEGFRTSFSGHTFRDHKGIEHKVVVEYAPYQKLPKSSSRPARKGRPLEKDPDYLKFVDKLNEPIKPLPSAEIQLEQREELEKDLPPKTTPLLEHIRKKRALKAKKLQARAKRSTDKTRKRVKEKQSASQKATKEASGRGRKRIAERKKKKEPRDSKAAPRQAGSSSSSSVPAGGVWKAVSKQLQLTPAQQADQASKRNPSKSASKRETKARRGTSGRGASRGRSRGAPKRVYAPKSADPKAAAKMGT